jgi:hypothetical protein
MIFATFNTILVVIRITEKIKSIEIIEKKIMKKENILEMMKALKTIVN